MNRILLLLLPLISAAAYSQDLIFFAEPLQIVAKEKVFGDIRKGSVLTAIGISYSKADQVNIINIIAEDPEGKRAYFPAKKIDEFDFPGIDNVDKTWNKYLLLNGTYASLMEKGFQYDLRNNLNDDAIDYVNALRDRFFNDEYLEDYFYTLLSKIHLGILNDKRPGNIYIKIVKDPEPNAFSLPNGCILITTGLISTIQSEDELIGILAHEVAHFVLDHQVLNYNKELDRQKRADFWAAFATGIAATADAYLTVNNSNHVPGVLTVSTAIAATAFSNEVVARLGIKYNRDQETEADNASKEILGVLKYEPKGLSIALQRIRDYSVVTGNYLALTSSGSHPGLDSRISGLGKVDNPEKFSQPSFLKKVSLVNSYNAEIELWSFAHHVAANGLAERNIQNGVATESDYIVKAVVRRRLSNTSESNEEVLALLNKAKTLNVTPYIILSKEEGITYIRLQMKSDAKKSFQTYLAQLVELTGKNDNQIEWLDTEIMWTKKMIFKVDNL